MSQYKGEIPGFYYDEGKGKYFQILPGHRGPRPGAKTSKDEIFRTRREKQSREEAQNRAVRIAKETVQSVSSRPSYKFASLNREIGHRSRISNVYEDWAVSSASGFEISTICTKNVCYFERDPVTKSLFVANPDGTIEWIRPSKGLPRPRNAQSTNSGTMTYAQLEHTWDAARRAKEDRQKQINHPLRYEPKGRFIDVLGSEITSFHQTPDLKMLVVTTAGCGSTHPKVHLLHTPGSDEFGLHAEAFSPSNADNISCAAPRLPSKAQREMGFTDDAVIAFGADNLLGFAFRGTTGTWDFQPRGRFGSDILSLTWLDEDRVVVGCRDGKVWSWEYNTNRSYHILTHPTPVQQIRRADPSGTRLVVSGLSNTLALYDIRTPQPRGNGSEMNERDTHGSSDHPPNHKRKRRRKSKRHDRLPASTPTMLFQHYTNADFPDLGLDVHETLGLLAAADEDGNVLLWSLRSGRLIKKFRSTGFDSGGGSFGAHSYKDRVRCVRFVEDEEGVAIWANVAGRILRFGW